MTYNNSEDNGWVNAKPCWKQPEEEDNQSCYDSIDHEGGVGRRDRLGVGSIRQGRRWRAGHNLEEITTIKAVFK